MTRIGSTAALQKSLSALQQDVVGCGRCPRLVRYRRALAREHPEWWCRPVPSFGDSDARILIVGLAPGRAGSNRTGRMFTGDASGRFLYPTLHALGLANQPDAEPLDDGLQLFSIYITATARCVPPQNKPLPDELARCHRFLVEELARLAAVRVVVSLGRIAHQAVLKALTLLPSRYPFAHGAEYSLSGQPAFLLASYHPSRQNTQTGRLTASMFRGIFVRATVLANVEIPDPSLATRPSSLENNTFDGAIMNHERLATTEAGTPRQSRGVPRHRAGTIRAGAEVLRDAGPAGKCRAMPIARPSDDPSIRSEDLRA